MPDWIPGALVALLVALIGASGVWLAQLISRQSARQKRDDVLNKRIFRLINFCRRLMRQVEDLGGEPEQWPDDLYDE